MNTTALFEKPIVSGRLPGAIALVMLFVSLFLFQSGQAEARENIKFNGIIKSSVDANGLEAVKPLALKNIAIFPFDNLTLSAEAAGLVKNLVREELKGKGWVSIASDEDVEEFLGRRRIRQTGSITRLTARELGKVLGVDAVAVGTVTQYDNVSGRVAVGVSMRLVSTIDGSIVWADNLAYSGVEFEGILGLGSVKSLDVLSSLVVRDLVKSIADKFFVKDMAQSPFEIERVITFPAIGKAGDKVDIIVDIVPIMEEPKELRIIIDDIDYVLEKIREGKYKGEITAPLGEGVYSIDVVATNDQRVPFVFTAATKFTVDVTPPNVEMTLDSAVISTVHGKEVVMETKLRNVEVIEEWRVDITDADGNVVRSDFGFGFLPSRLVWKGEVDGTGVVGDGRYNIVLSVKDAAGNSARMEDVVLVRNTPPKIDVEFAFNDGVAEFRLIRPADAPLDEWTFAISDKDGAVLKLLSGSDADFPEKILYPMDEQTDIRRLAFSITAKDTVGNVYSETKRMPAMFREKVPFAEVIKGKDRLWSEF
ncbi:MAG: CsgG/HfaB family protein [Deltaproteobacteria bacterium]|nr:CsgG/HfaB family protein [Deltaproteobacteria bacterium]